MDAVHSQWASMAWGLGAAQQEHLSKLAVPQGLIRLYQLLLFTMPGTPVFTYGDEIGLQTKVSEREGSRVGLLRVYRVRTSRLCVCVVVRGIRPPRWSGT